MLVLKHVLKYVLNMALSFEIYHRQDLPIGFDSCTFSSVFVFEHMIRRFVRDRLSEYLRRKILWQS